MPIKPPSNGFNGFGPIGAGDWPRGSGKSRFTSPSSPDPPKSKGIERKRIEKLFWGHDGPLAQSGGKKIEKLVTKVDLPAPKIDTHGAAMKNLEKILGEKHNLQRWLAPVPKQHPAVQRVLKEFNLGPPDTWAKLNPFGKGPWVKTGAEEGLSRIRSALADPSWGKARPNLLFPGESPLFSAPSANPLRSTTVNPSSASWTSRGGSGWSGVGRGALAQAPKWMQGAVSAGATVLKHPATKAVGRVGSRALGVVGAGLLVHDAVKFATSGDPGPIKRTGKKRSNTHMYLENIPVS